MKVTVIIGSDGEIVGTASSLQAESAERPKGSFTALLVPGPGQTAHEIDLPTHLEKIQSAENFHQALKEHISKQRS